jgi:hypothetical protein
MSRMPRLQKKLYETHLISIACDAIADEALVSRMWNLAQGESVSLDDSTLNSEPLSRYKLRLNVVRGPVPGSWTEKPFDPEELEVWFFADGNEDICHGWVLYRDAE